MRGKVTLFTGNKEYLDDFFAHEGGHNLEKGKYIISKDKTYRKLSNLDMEQRRNGIITITEKPRGLHKQSKDKIWISNYAENPMASKNTDFIEDWAESVSAYENANDWFKQNYPNRYEYIDKLFKEYEKTGKMTIPPKGINI